MKKSILVGVLAAMMLFAFTACDNSTPEAPIYGNATVVGASLASAPDYLEGEKLDPSEITVNVLLNVGDPIAYNGTEMGIVVGDDDILSAGANTVAVTIPGTELKYDITVYAYEIEAVTVNLNPVQTTISLSEPKLSLEGISASITYGGGKTMTKTVPASAMPVDELVQGKKNGEVIDLGAYLKEMAEEVEDFEITVNGNWKLTVSDVAKTVRNVTITPNNKVEFFTVGSNTKLTADTFDFTATITYSDNTTDVLTKAELAEANGYGYEILNLGTSGVTFSKDLTSFTLKVAIVDEDNEDALIGTVQDVKISATEDYPTKFKVTQVKKTDKPSENEYTYWIGDDFAPQEFVFEITEMASKKTLADEDKKIEYSDFKVVSPSKIKDGYTAEGTHSVTVTFEYIGSKKGAVAAEKPTCTVTLTAPSTTTDEG